MEASSGGHRRRGRQEAQQLESSWMEMYLLGLIKVSVLAISKKKVSVLAHGQAAERGLFFLLESRLMGCFIRIWNCT